MKKTLEKIDYYVNEEKKTVTCIIFPDTYRMARFIGKYTELFFTPYKYTDPMFPKFVGIARCHPEDEFDVEFGKKLAYSRARDKCDRSFFKQLQNFINALDFELNELVMRSNDYGAKLTNHKNERQETLEAFINK